MQLSKKAEDVHARLNSQWSQRRGRGKELSYEKMRERGREKKKGEKVSISSTFYAQIFCTKVLRAAFL